MTTPIRKLYTGRPVAYTEIGISRVPCTRCGAPSTQQWQACANGRYYVGICDDCDIELNRLVLRFMKIKHRARLLAEYARRLRGKRSIQEKLSAGSVTLISIPLCLLAKVVLSTFCTATRQSAAVNRSAQYAVTGRTVVFMARFTASRSVQCREVTNTPPLLRLTNYQRLCRQ